MTFNAVLLDALSRLQPLQGLGADSLRGLASHCTTERVARSLDPFRLKDWNGQVVYLLKGELKMDLEDGSTALLVGGTDSALLPLGRNGGLPRATRAVTDVELLRFDADMLDVVLTWDQLAANAGGSDTQDWRSMSGMFAAQNFGDGIFASLPPANIDTLLGRFHRMDVRRGDVVIRQGEVGDYYYLIDKGRATVTREVAGATVELAELRSGDAFGEEALLADATRNATVAMKTDGVLLRLDKADFVALLKEPLLRKVSPAQARQRISEGALWIDTRFPAEYRHDGLPGAVNIPLNEIRGAAAMLERDKEYIAYCQSGRRSSAAAFLLSQRGYRASLLDGGLKALFNEKGNGAA